MMKRPGFFKFTAAAILASFLAVCAGCGTHIQKKPLKEMNIGMSRWVGYGPFYLGKEKGLFEKEGIDLVIVIEELDSARRDAFNTGMLDSEAGAINLLVTKRAYDTPVVSVCALDYSCGADGIVAAENINTVEDLLGKRVALARDDSGETFLTYLFYKRALPFDRLQLVAGSPENISDIFIKGDADAVVTWEPELSRALSRPGSRMIASSKEFPDIIVDTLDVREDIIKNDPDAVKALMRGWFSAVEYYKAHPEESIRIMSEYFGMSPEDYKKSIQGLEWSDYPSQNTPSAREKWIGTFDIIAEAEFSKGRIPKKPSAESAINTELLKALYERPGGR